MTINTRDFGEIEISENDILNFPEGIYAFEENRRYVLLSPCGVDKYPMWLQSVDNANVCFIVFNPLEFAPAYSVTPDEDAARILACGNPEDIQYFVIAVIPENYINTTLNMKSPIAVNTLTRTAAQVIAQENYPIKFPAFKKEGG